MARLARRRAGKHALVLTIVSTIGAYGRDDDRGSPGTTIPASRSLPVPIRRAMTRSSASRAAGPIGLLGTALVPAGAAALCSSEGSIGARDVIARR